MFVTAADGLLMFRSDAFNVFCRHPQPFQKRLMTFRMARFKYLVESLHLGIIQTQLPKHPDPFFNAYR
jgi:hypothetical protein